MKLRIEGEGITARGYRVYLDDVDVTNGLRRLELRLDPTEINTAEIVLAPDEITVSAEALASLTAIGRAAEAKCCLYGIPDCPCTGDPRPVAEMKAEWQKRYGEPVDRPNVRPAPTAERPDPSLTEKKGATPPSDSGGESFWARVFPWLWR